MMTYLLYIELIPNIRIKRTWDTMVNVQPNYIKLLLLCIITLWDSLSVIEFFVW